MRRTFGFFVFSIVALPVVVAVVILVSGDHWFPAGDMAQAELHMKGFFGHPPLVGAAGRIVSDAGFQGSHPGPSPWIAMLPVYLLGGRSSDALMAAAASVHLAAIAGTLWCAYRRGGRTLTLLVAIALLAVVRSSGVDFMIEPWNPWLALLPFGLFVFLILEIVSPPVGSDVGSVDLRRPPYAQLAASIVVGSHCVQCHAGYVLITVPFIATAIALILCRGFRASRSSDGRPGLQASMAPLLIALGTAGIVWLPTMIDQLRREPGNLTILLQHFGTPSEPSLGWGRTLDVATTQLNLAGPWLLGPNAASTFPADLLGFMGFLGLLSSAAVVARRTGMQSEFRVLSCLVAMIVLGLLSISRIFGPFFEYTIRWIWLLTSLSSALSIWVLARSRICRPTPSAAAARSLPRMARTSLWTAAAALTVLSSIQVQQRAKLPGATDSRIIGGVIDELADGLRRDSTYQIRFYDPYTLNATGFGLVLELERRGFDVKVDPEFAAAALPHRTAPMWETDEVLWVVVGPAVEAARRDEELELISSYNPRSTQEQERASLLIEEIRRGLVEAGRIELVSSLFSPGASILFADPPLPDETAELVRELIAMGQPTGVFKMSVDGVARSLQ